MNVEDTTKIRHFLVSFFIRNKLSLILVCILFLPLLALLFFSMGSAASTAINQSSLLRYIANSLTVGVLTTLGSLIIGIPCAWLVSTYTFPGKRLFELFLIFPKAIPAYISAFGLRETFAYPGLFARMLSALTPAEHTVSLSIHSIWGLALVLSLALYPYIYLAARASFLQQSKNLLDATRGLESSRTRVFFTVVLPLSRPALGAVACLVFVESLNEYGAASYLGVQTLTTEIFKAWTYAYNFQFARLCSLLLAGIVLFVLIAENRSSKHFHFTPTAHPVSFSHTSLLKQLSIMAVLCVPVILGFILPLSQLGYWSFLKIPDWNAIGLLAARSLIITSITTVLCLVTSLLVINHHSILRLQRNTILSGALNICYAIPGAVMAIGIIMLRESFTRLYAQLFLIEPLAKTALGGSLIILIYGLCIRYIVVAYGPLYGGFSTRCRLFAEASRSLGKNNIATLFHVHVPIMKQLIIATTILTFIDILRDLPLTMLLQPFNFTTLPVEVHFLIENELVIDAAFPALCLVVLGLLPLFFFARIESIPLCNLHKRNISRSPE